MVENYLNGWEKILDFSGKSNRAEFWTFTIVNAILETLFAGLLGGTLGAIVGILLFIANLAIGTRRLHDINKSGLNWLWIFLPLIGWIILIVYWLTPSK